MIASPAPRSPAAITAPVLEFKGSRLGMSLVEWRGAPFPGVASPAVRPVCSDDAQAADRLGLDVSAAQLTAREVVCTYAFPGPGGAREPVPINDLFYARHVRYVFREGRLVEISFLTSVDAFDDMVARINAQMGPAIQTTRDTAVIRHVVLPRVRMAWSGPAGRVSLVDPVAGTGRIAVDYVAPEQPASKAGGV